MTAAHPAATTEPGWHAIPIETHRAERSISCGTTTPDPDVIAGCLDPARGRPGLVPGVVWHERVVPHTPLHSGKSFVARNGSRTFRRRSRPKPWDGRKRGTPTDWMGDLSGGLGVSATAGRALDAAAHARDRDRLVASKSQQAQIWIWTRHAPVTETVTLFRALCYWGRSLTRAASCANTLVIGRPRVATPSPAGPSSWQASAG